MSLERVRDQQVAVRALKRILAQHRVPNGMLFWGPGGVGKHMTAMEFTKAVNCRESANDACDTCLSCRKVVSGNHPDVRVISPSDRSREIKKAEIDEVNEMAALRPFEGGRRVFVLEDADRMNAVAQNHFLKTLEEPPGQSVFILLTEYPRLLLPTIRSRCQMIRFRALRPETVIDLLREQRDLPAETAQAIAHVSEGRMTRALDLVDTDRRDVVLSVVHRLAEGADPVKLADEFAKYLNGHRKQLEAQVNAEFDRYAGESAREDVDRLKEARVAHLTALVRRDILEYLYLFETWYRDEMVFAALGDTERLWHRDQSGRLRAGAIGASDAKLHAIEEARHLLDRYIPEDRVFRELFFSLAAT